MQNRAPSFLILCLACGPLLQGCGPSNASEHAEGQPTGARQREIPTVRVAPVERREMLQVLETTSVLESEREIQVFPRMSGVVVEVLAEEGERVLAGQVLARLDDADVVLGVRDAEVALSERENDAQIAELAIEEAKGLLESIRLATAQRERDYNRNVQLFEESETKPLSRQEIEASRLELDRARGDEVQAEVTWRRRQAEQAAAQTAVARARVTLERARLLLDHTRVLAPFEGVVAERTVRLGDTVGSQQPSFVLTDPLAIRAIFFRPQEELGLFTRSDADGLERLGFRATTEAFPGREFSGDIERISPTIDEESGQFRVTARLHAPEDGGPALLPGMLVRMRIVTDRHPEALVVPKRALRREGDRRFVLVALPAGAGAEVGSQAETREGAAGEYLVGEVDVREGFADEESVEVLPGAHELGVGTLVIVVGGRDLAPGDPVGVDALGDAGGEE